MTNYGRYHLHSAPVRYCFIFVGKNPDQRRAIILTFLSLKRARGVTVFHTDSKSTVYARDRDRTTEGQSPRNALLVRTEGPWEASYAGVGCCLEPFRDRKVPGKRRTRASVVIFWGQVGWRLRSLLAVGGAMQKTSQRSERQGETSRPWLAASTLQTRR